MNNAIVRKVSLSILRHTFFDEVTLLSAKYVSVSLNQQTISGTFHLLPHLGGSSDRGSKFAYCKSLDAVRGKGRLADPKFQPPRENSPPT